MPESSSKPSKQLPIWGKILAFFCIAILVVNGFGVAFVPGWEIRHVRSPVGLKLEGITAIIVGLGIVIYSGFLVLITLYPDHWIWTSWSKPDEEKEVNETESDHES